MLRPSQHFYALLMAMFGWVLFRSDIVSQGINCFSAMLGFGRTSLIAQSLTCYVTKQVLWSDWFRHPIFCTTVAVEPALEPLQALTLLIGCFFESTADGGVTIDRIRLAGPEYVQYGDLPLVLTEVPQLILDRSSTSTSVSR
jgi:hypothetical protein